MRRFLPSFKRMTATLMTLAMVLGMVPTTAGAVNIGGKSYDYNWSITTTSGGIFSGYGTSDPLQLAFYLWNGTTVYKEILDDIDRGSTKSGRITVTEFHPWEIGEVKLHITSNDGIKFDSFSLGLADGWGEINKRTVNYAGGQSLDDKGTVTLFGYPTGFNRALAGKGDFDAVFTDTIYLEEGKTSGNRYGWNRMVTDQFGSYNPTSYPGAPTLSCAISGQSQTGQADLTADSVVPAIVTDPANFSYGVDEGHLYSKMREQGVYKLDVTTTLAFPIYYNQYAYTYHATRTYIRPEFQLGDIYVWANTYTNQTGNQVQYLNQDTTGITVEVPVLSMNHYDNVAIAESLATSLDGDLSKVRLFYGKGEGALSDYDQRDYSHPTSVTAGGNFLYFHFAVPQGFQGDGSGLELGIYDATATYQGRTYTYYNSNPYNDGSAREEGGYNDYFSQYVSDRQVDTQGDRLTIGGTGFDAAAQSHRFTLTADAPYLNGKQDHFAFQLYQGETLVPMNTNTNAAAAPYANGYAYQVAPTTGYEGTYTLAVEADDAAGNGGRTTAQMTFDTWAPRITLNRSDVQPDQGKYAVYDFDITDATGDSKVYYCFVAEGSALSDPDTLPDIRESQPEISSNIGEWMYIQQGGATTSALLGVDDVTKFEGTLYYYAVDALGNDSRTQTTSGTGRMVDGKFYHTMDATLDGTRGKATLLATNSVTALTDYQIAFELNTPHTTLDYRWYQGSQATDWLPYTGGDEVGKAAITLSDGTAVNMDGTWNLDYRVTYTPTDGGSPVVDTYSDYFVFDNSAPTISLTYGDVDVTATEQISYYVSDRSRVATIRYWLVDEDGEKIPGNDQVHTRQVNTMTTRGALTIAPKLSGAYRLAVEATDLYGNSAMAYTGFFSVRVQAPQVTATLLTQAPSQEAGSTSLLSANGNVFVRLDVVEPVVNVAHFEGNQTIRYQASDDGANYNAYTSWQQYGYTSVGEPPENSGIRERDYAYLTPEGDALVGTVYVWSPGTIATGVNYLHLAVATASAPSKDTAIAPAAITYAKDLKYTWDNTLPYYHVASSSSVRALEEITTLIYGGDYYCDTVTLTANDHAVTVTPSAQSPSESFSNAFDVTVTKNGDYTLTVTDQVGYTHDFILQISNIVETVPTVTVDPPVCSTDDPMMDTGMRQDYRICGVFKDVSASSIRFLVVDAADAAQVTAENFAQTPAAEGVQLTTAVSYQNATTPYTSEVGYEVTVRTTRDGDYAVIAYATDDVGQVLCEPFGDRVSPTALLPETAGYEGVSSATAAAVATVPLTFNVPVVVIPTSKMGDLDHGDIGEYLESAARRGAYSTSYDFIITQADLGETLTFYAIDQLDNILAFEVEIPADAVTFTGGDQPLTQGITVELWESDEISSDSKETLLTPETTPIAYGEGSRSLFWYVKADDATIQPVAAQEVIELQDAHHQELYIPDAVETVEIVELPTEALEEDAAELPTEEPTERSTEEPAESPAEELTELPTQVPAEASAELPLEEVVEVPDQVPAEDDEMFVMAPPMEEIRTLAGVDYPTQFFTVSDAYNMGSGVSLSNPYSATWDSQTLWGDEVTRYKDMTLLLNSYGGVDGALNAYFFSHTLKTDGDPTNLEDYVVTAEYLDISFVDTTGATVATSVSNREWTAQPVRVTYTVYDDQAKPYGSNKIAKATGVESLAVILTAWSDFEHPVITNLTVSPATVTTIGNQDAKEPGVLYYNSDREAVEYVVEITQPSMLTLDGTTALGLGISSEGESSFVEVSNIYVRPITQGLDYDIVYRDADGTMIDPEGYYKEVTANIEPTSVGEEIGLTARNNGGSLSVKLDANTSSFAFDLTDQYGNTGTAEVAFDRYDNQSPTATWSLNPSTLTNQPVTITLTVQDQGSGVDTVVVDGNSLQPTQAQGDTYTYQVTTGGNYAFQVADKTGNTTTISVPVTQLDTTVPQATVSYNRDPEVNTTANMVAKLTYDKANVSALRAEALDGGAPSRFLLNTGENTLRFFENAKVKVTFLDGYGNQGSVEIHVTNIQAALPALEAKMVSTNGVTGDENGVYFVETAANETPLEALTVLHKGLARPVCSDESDPTATYDAATDAYYTTYEFTTPGTYAFAIYDQAGNTQYLTATVTIDTAAPEITKITWSYTNADGVQGGSRNPGDEAGYRILEGEHDPATKEDVTVTVTTDTPTAFVGDAGAYATDHQVVYDENGLFSFHLQKENQRYDSYIVGIYLIDKLPPVIQNSQGDPLEDLVFYANAKAGEGLSREALYDFVVTDVVPDYGTQTIPQSQVEVTVTDAAGNLSSIDALVALPTAAYSKDTPYQVTYTATDAVGNVTQHTRMVTLVGARDCVTLVNGQFPDSSSRSVVDGDGVTLWVNNGGDAYVRYVAGSYTVGEMKQKTRGVTLLTGTSDQRFTVDNLPTGWYTFYVQTTSADYFAIRVYMNH